MEKWFWAMECCNLQDPNKRKGPYYTKDQTFEVAQTELGCQGLLFDVEGETFFVGVALPIALPTLSVDCLEVLGAFVEHVVKSELVEEEDLPANCVPIDPHARFSGDMESLDDELHASFWAWAKKRDIFPIRSIVGKITEHRRGSNVSYSQDR